MEHSLDVGAKATEGHKNRLVWWSYTFDRDSVKNLEDRIYTNIQRSPFEVKRMVEEFDELLNLMRPPKGLRQLEQEQRSYDINMGRSFYCVPVMHRNAKCGWDVGPGGELYETGNTETLLQIKREQDALESVGGTFRARAPRPACLTIVEAL